GLVARLFVSFRRHTAAFPLGRAEWAAGHAPARQLTGLRRGPYQGADGAPHGAQKGTRSGVPRLPSRGCPRNCSRRACGRYATGNRGRWPGATSREPGYLPSLGSFGLPEGQPRRDEMATSTTAPVASTTQRSEALRAAAVALLLGLGLIFLTGFAYPEVIHNAAHDTRHGLSFPCH